MKVSQFCKTKLEKILKACIRMPQVDSCAVVFELISQANNLQIDRHGDMQ